MAYAPLQYSFPRPATMDQLPYSSKTDIPLQPKESFLEYPALNEGSKPLPRRNVFVSVLVFAWKTLFLPAMALAYLAFCYVVHYRIVKISGIENPMEHLSVIKAGVTSITILFITLSLLPLSNLISDLKSEEFFRVLSGKHMGARLDTVNSISTPSYGMRDSLVTLYRQHASTYFTGAFIAGLLALAVSTLAPAALSVDTVLFDTDVLALSIGAMQRNSILNSTDFAQPSLGGPVGSALVKASEGGSIAWAEISLHVNFSFQSPTVDQTTYIVPTPSKLTTDVPARWLTDTIAMQPSCEWIAPQFENPGANLSDFSTGTLIANLTSKRIQMKIDPFTLGSGDFAVSQLTSGWFAGLGAGVTGDWWDLDTLDDLTNGATGWLLYKCVEKCDSDGDGGVNVTLGSDVSSTRYSSSNGRALDITILYCAPNAQIKTHRVSNDGKGLMSVGDEVPTTQGNLHPVQTNLMLSYALSDLGKAGSESTTNISRLGTQIQVSLMFGEPDFSASQFTPQPLNRISEAYGRVLKSATKPFLDGSLASANVPARTTRELPVFTSSLPHVIASTVLYMILAAFVLVCHFRRHVPQFTFFSVAASLARSDIPPLFAQVKESEKSQPSDNGGVGTLGKSRVLFEGGDVLKLRMM